MRRIRSLIFATKVSADATDESEGRRFSCPSLTSNLTTFAPELERTAFSMSSTKTSASLTSSLRQRWLKKTSLLGSWTRHERNSSRPQNSKRRTCSKDGATVMTSFVPTPKTMTRSSIQIFRAGLDLRLRSRLCERLCFSTQQNVSQKSFWR